MKTKLLFILVALLGFQQLATAQSTFDEKRLDAFFNEIKNVGKKHVKVRYYDVDSIKNDLISQVRSQLETPFSHEELAQKLKLKLKKAPYAVSLDEEGYKAIKRIFLSYINGVDEFAGLPMTANTKNTHENAVVFSDDYNFFMFKDSLSIDKCDVAYMDYNPIKLLSQLMQMQFGEQMNKFKFIEVVSEDNDEKVTEPTLVKNSEWQYYVAIPEGTGKEGGVFEWINTVFFGKVNEHDSGQRGFIHTPENILLEYMKQSLPTDRWLLKKDVAMEQFASEYYDGGTPCYLVRESVNEKGYEDMIKDIDCIFGPCKGGDFSGMEVTDYYDGADGTRYRQLYNDKALMIVLDVPAEKYCLMMVYNGFSGGIASMVNSYEVDTETCIADKMNIFMNIDGSVTFSREPYTLDGVTYTHGVHGKAEKLEQFWLKRKAGKK